MGVAAYNRGSLRISRQICDEYGCRGCVRCTEYKPIPRPPTWGERAKAKALERARRVLAGIARYGLPRPTQETLAAVVQDRERVGEETAQAAARTALDEAGEIAFALAVDE